MKLGFSRQILEKYSNIKFIENLSNGSRVVSCGRMDGRTDGQTGRQAGRNRQAGRQEQAGRQAGITNLIVAFHNFANPPKNVDLICLVALKWLILLFITNWCCTYLYKYILHV
jgi:hypothetical protein